MLTREDLLKLARVSNTATASVYLPTHTAGGEIRQDPIRLKNLLDQAEAKLVDAGYRYPECEAMLSPARELVSDGDFWRHQNRGLAVFAAPSFFRYERLSAEPDELVVVAPHFHLRPLFSKLSSGEEFYVLAVSASRARLLRATPQGARELEVAMPDGVAEIGAETDYESTRHAAPAAGARSPGAGGLAGTHNFGEAPEEQRKAQLIEYLRRVVSATKSVLGGRDTPLVLAAQPEIQGHLRALAKGLPILDKGIATNPDVCGLAELHPAALEVAMPVLDDVPRELDRLAALLRSGDAHASSVPEEILKAARQGRVQTVFVAASAHLWAKVEEDERIVAHGSPLPGDEDLLDRAAVETFTHGGRVE